MRALGFAVLVTLATIGVSCKKSATAPSTTELTGTWRATIAQFTSVANSNVKAEVIAKGTTIVLVLDASHAATLTITDPGMLPQVRTANWSASADELTLSWTGGVMGEAQFDMTLSTNTLTLDGGHVPYDVDGNGSLDESILNMTMARQ